MAMAWMSSAGCPVTVATSSSDRTYSSSTSSAWYTTASRHDQPGKGVGQLKGGHSMTVPAVPGPPGGRAIILDTERHAEAIVLAVAGEIDLLTAPQLEQAVLSALDERPPVLIIDLLEVTFLASTGMSTLVKAYQKATSQTRLRVVATGSVTLRPLELTGLTPPLAVYPSRDAAIGAD
jgi:anti-anti-sigma factor